MSKEFSSSDACLISNSKVDRHLILAKGCCATIFISYMYIVGIKIKVECREKMVKHGDLIVGRACCVTIFISYW